MSLNHRGTETQSKMKKVILKHRVLLLCAAAPLWLIFFFLQRPGKATLGGAERVTSIAPRRSVRRAGSFDGSGCPKAVVGADRDDREPGLHFEASVSASMVGDLENVDVPRKGVQIAFEVAGQKCAPPLPFEHQYQGIVVVNPGSREPVTWRIHDPERADSVSRPQPTNRYVASVDLLDQFSVPGDEGVVAQPDFTDFEVANQIEQTIHMVVMGMRQCDRVQTPESSREQVRADDVFPDRKSALAPRGAIATRGDSASIHDDPFTIGQFDQC